MRHMLKRLLLVVALGAALHLPAHAEQAAAPAQTAAAPLAELVKGVDIPYDSFTLPNGLRVVVHSDRKAPLVSVGVWYHVGSKDEPVGKSGFAHLFEHLMFYGSEHSKVEHFVPLEAVGASDFNGTTSFDRTNYYQTVPTTALDLALFLESDRMGWLLPALTQERLDAQRKVVLNEKRQGDNEPYGLVSYALFSGLFSSGNPYSQSTIGRPADLERASLADAKYWFGTRYGPNNAVLVLAGDIDVREARPMVEKWFGQIPAGPTPPRFAVPPPSRTQTVRRTLHDRIATTRLMRAWAAPSGDDPDAIPLSIAMTVLGGGQTSRLEEALVRREKLAVGVSASYSDFEKAGIAAVTVDLAPGADPAKVEARLDALIADFLARGPTQDEVERVAMRAVSGTIRGLEKVGGSGGKGAALAEGMLYYGDPGRWRTDLLNYARATPEAVRAAAARRIAHGDLRLTILPGDREAGDLDPANPTRTVSTPEKPAAASKPVGVVADRSSPPAAGPATDFTLPPVEKATLSNGMQLAVIHRDAIPVVRMSMVFPIGVAGDSREKPGLQQLMLSMMDEGSNGRLGALDGPEVTMRLERLGGALSASASLDRTRFAVNALKPNLDQTLALFSDMVRAPAFPASELERVRGQALTSLKAEENDPMGIAYQALPQMIYGIVHPYGASFTGSGTEAGLKAVTRDDLLRFHRRLNPAVATLLVIGDTSLQDMRPRLERLFGDWKGTPVTASAPIPSPMPPAPHILFIDRPGSPQGMILAGAATPLTGSDDGLALSLKNDVFGGLTTSRLFQLLREEKGWSYGAYSGLSETRGAMPFIIQAPVETDHVGDSIVAIRQVLDGIGGSAPPTAKEIANARMGMVRGLPGQFETMGALMSATERNQMLDRPDDYLTTLPRRLLALPDAAVAEAPLPPSSALSFVVVGDAQKLLPQLHATGLKVEVRAARDR